jgi:hypothetical protein
MSANDLLLAVGVSLCLIGVMLRGLHQGQRRADALRAQTARLARLDGKEDTLNAPAAPRPLLVRHLPWVYRGLVLVGLVLTLWAYAKR